MPIVYTNRSALSKWDLRFIELAEHIAQWSKGPRKRIGAVIVRPDRSIASMGYNGPPRGFDDEAFLRMTREQQHSVVTHAEENAINQMGGDDVIAISNAMLNNNPEQYTLYVSPLLPCSPCAVETMSSGIQRVVAYCGHISPDWRASAYEAERIFIEYGVECIFAFKDEQ